jgi:phytoene dehydrogenase-like protein
MADNIVSDADPAVTFEQLLPRSTSARERRKAHRAEYSISLLSVFCAVEMDLSRLGYDSGNYWWYRDRDVGRLYEAMERSLPGATVDGLFLSVTSLKDPGHTPHGHHTIEMFTFALRPVRALEGHGAGRRPRVRGLKEEPATRCSLRPRTSSRGSAGDSIPLGRVPGDQRLLLRDAVRRGVAPQDALPAGPFSFPTGQA